MPIRAPIQPDLKRSEDSKPGESAGCGQSVYDRLRALAAEHLQRERAGHTLQATALAHEAYLRLASREQFQQLDSTECLYLASQAIRSVLVDHARRRNAQKRGGDLLREPLDDVVLAYERSALDLEVLDVALTALQREHPVLSQIVCLRFFGGLSEIEIAATLQVSARTVRRGWSAARTWLHRRITGGPNSEVTGD